MGTVLRAVYSQQLDGAVRTQADAQQSARALWSAQRTDKPAP